MKSPFRFALAPSLLLLVSLAPGLRAQKLPLAAAAPASLDDRRKALSQLIHDFWDDTLKHDPELASAVGDSRYNDQVSDYSVAAINDRLAREQNDLLRLAAIDPTGFTDEQQRSQNELLARFEDDQTNADQKQWEMPVTEQGGIYSLYPELAGELSFTTAKDYDDWTARLHALPEAFEQVTANMEIGMEDGNVPPKAVREKALAEVSALAHQKPENSPLAAPLKRFPASISAADQQRIRGEMLEAIGKEALPAYLKFERFLQVSYVPAGGAGTATPATAKEAIYSQQGTLAVVELRARAQKALGAKFETPAFGDLVLSVGALPVDAVEQRVDAWIAAEGKAGAQ